MSCQNSNFLESNVPLHHLLSTMANENLAPRVLATHLKELRELIEKPMDDIKVLPVGDDVTEVLAVISGPTGTPFSGGEFRVRLQLGPDYPSAPPKGWFMTKIFHPNVAQAGDICVSSLKKDWKPELGIKHALMAIRCLLICPFAESALNEEAGRLLLEDYDSYARHATMFTEIHAKKASDAKTDKVAEVKAVEKKKVEAKRSLKRL
eukprot:TRINITY_DN12946_c0_g1_i1.p1 TRINITY_DN12946_c0_g1~~TRINITY_DN12946_c0_g1_i1.p1  ORF type:complete len:207 (+),score=11.69 TRINITY_DN12946_c0_g1_i1:1-621(+)